MTVLVLGAKSRINEWFAPPSEQRQLPWATSGFTPPTTSDALEWIAVQDKLLSLGYNQTQIQQIYSIQVAEWKQASGDKKSSSSNLSSLLPSSPNGKEFSPVQMVIKVPDIWDKPDLIPSENPTSSPTQMPSPSKQNK
jgi:hypothetical protein